MDEGKYEIDMDGWMESMIKLSNGSSIDAL